MSNEIPDPYRLTYSGAAAANLAADLLVDAKLITPEQRNEAAAVMRPAIQAALDLRASQ